MILKNIKNTKAFTSRRLSVVSDSSRRLSCVLGSSRQVFKLKKKNNNESTLKRDRDRGRERETDRDRDKERERGKQIQKDRQRDTDNFSPLTRLIQGQRTSFQPTIMSFNSLLNYWMSLRISFIFCHSSWYSMASFSRSVINNVLIGDNLLEKKTYNNYWLYHDLILYKTTNNELV